jgi:ABC-type branched-subunit amino acid transport system ATPase component
MHSIDDAHGNVLKIKHLDVFYGQAHALQDVSLALGAGVLAVVGKNGMGKSTLCKAITGLVPASGEISFNGQSLLGLAPHDITHAGVAYVPQGRRVWRSLTVDETLRLAAKTALLGAWTVERVYQTFPRLAQRRNNGGGQLSGGEQQMLAIARALLFNPKLLVMDEPTEGLAPVIVEQVATLLKRLASERTMSVLLIEQNLGVALEVAERVAIMVNGRIQSIMPAAKLAADKALQQKLLGVSSGAVVADENLENETEKAAVKIWKIVRQYGDDAGYTGYTGYR